MQNKGNIIAKGGIICMYRLALVDDETGALSILQGIIKATPHKGKTSIHVANVVK